MDWLPAHKASLRLTHNEHKDYYQTVEVWDEDGVNDWLSDEDRQRAIETDSVWCLLWHTETPIGFYRLCASSLESLEAHFRAIR